ncbi:hypothetical protein [Streptomyces sp. NBC_00019]|uniref:hypothetical protein n=1 Tax=Streptomyces sp. NBC_00019 TaxID=2975623 RepID=UPI0032534893
MLHALRRRRRLQGVSPPLAYCLYEDGSTHNLATGAQFVFWVCFVSSVLLLGAGLWQVARNPGTLVRQFLTEDSSTS